VRQSLADGPDGSTPLDQDEVDELVPTHLASRDDLNEWEQQNILDAVNWLENRKPKSSVLGIDFLLELHRRMFSSTWEWAGRTRKSDKTLGVHWPMIMERLKALVDDTLYWIEHCTYSVDEIAVRFHSRLVAIHPFPNGNGRHGRLATDVLLEEIGGQPFTWGPGSIDIAGETREHYLAAMRATDKGDICPLLEFSRS